MIKSLDQNFLQKVAGTLSTRAVAALGNLLLLAIIAHTLGQDTLGQFSLALSILFGGGTLSRFGTDIVVLRQGSIAWSGKGHSRLRGIYLQTFSLALGISIFLSLGLYSFSELLSSLLFNKPEMAEAIKAVSVVLPVFTIMFLQSSWLKVSGLPQLSPLTEAGGAALLTGAVVFGLSASGFEASTAQLILLLGCSMLFIYLIGSGVLWVKFRSREKSDDETKKITYAKGFIKSLPDFALPAMMSYFSNWGVIFILGFHADYSEVGALTIALRVALLVHAFSTVVMAVIVPKFGPLHHENRLGELEAMIHKGTLFSLLVGGPLALTMIFFPSYWSNVFGATAPHTASLIAILALAQLVNVSLGPVGMLLYMTGLEKYMRRIVLSVGSIGVVSALVLTPLYGVFGAAGAVAFIICTQNIAAALVVRRLLGFLAMPRLWR